MKRELKFRAHHPHQKKMVYSTDIGTFFDHNIFPYQNWDIMQFTGLKDKNGIDIYESDVLDWIKGENHVVVFIHGRYLLKDSKGNTFNPVWEKHTKIIGNIHQNKELIE